MSQVEPTPENAARQIAVACRVFAEAVERGQFGMAEWEVRKGLAWADLFPEVVGSPPEPADA